MQSRRFSKTVSALGASVILFLPVNVPKVFSADGPKIDPIISSAQRETDANKQEDAESKNEERIGAIQINLIKHILCTNNDNSIPPKEKAAERANRIIDSLMDVYLICNSTATETEQNAKYAALVKEVDALKENFRKPLSEIKDEEDVAPQFSELVGYFEKLVRGITLGVLLADSSKGQ
jgi:hypothetical protein